MYILLHVKCPLFLSDFNKTLIFLDRSSKNTQITNFIKIRPAAADLFHAEEWTDGRTDTTKLIAAFRYFANAPKKRD